MHSREASQRVGFGRRPAASTPSTTVPVMDAGKNYVIDMCKFQRRPAQTQSPKNDQPSLGQRSRHRERFRRQAAGTGGAVWAYRPTQASGAATIWATLRGRSPFAMFSRLTPSRTLRKLTRRAIHTSCKCWAAPSYLTVSGLRPRT